MVLNYPKTGKHYVQFQASVSCPELNQSLNKCVYIILWFSIFKPIAQVNSLAPDHRLLKHYFASPLEALVKSSAALHNMLKFSSFSYIWLTLVFCPTCSSLMEVNMCSWVRDWRARLTAKAIFEMCGIGQLAPLLKQQTTSVCQHPDLCMSGMQDPSVTR